MYSGKSTGVYTGCELKEALGDAAGAVGKAALDEAKAQGKHKAKELISKYFGGDGITRPCAMDPMDGACVATRTTSF